MYHFFINQGSIVLYKCFYPIFLFVYPAVPYCFLSNNSLYRYTSFLINYFLVALGLCHCRQAFLYWGEWGLLFVAVHGLLIAVASRCRAQALGAWASVVETHGLWSMESVVMAVELLHSMQNLPWPGTEPMSPELAWGVLSTVSPREVLQYHAVFLITILHNRFYYLIIKSFSFILFFSRLLRLVLSISI